MSDFKKDNFFKQLGAELYKAKKTTGRGATVFLGAGSSIDSMVMSWPNMADKICDQFGYPVENGDSIAALQSQIENGVSPDVRYSWVSDYLKDKRPSLGHQYLTQLASMGYISNIITTNWDCLIEEALNRQISADRTKVYVRGLTPDEHIANALAHTTEQNDVVNIIKLHGDFHSKDLRITASEIDTIDEKLQDVLVSLFSKMTYIIGSSISDAHILRLFLRSKNKGARYNLSYSLKNSELKNFLSDVGIQNISGEKDVITLNHNKVRVGSFSHFFSQLNISVQKQILQDSESEMEGIKKEILSKEEVGLRYINTAQIEQQIEHFGILVKSQRPNLIVFINDPKAPGGMEIKRRLLPLLKDHGIRSVDLEISGEKGSRVFKRSVKGTNNFPSNENNDIKKIVILDAITFSGNTLKIAKSEIQSLYPDALVKSGVLVISKMLEDRAAESGVDFFNAITDRFEIHFPWGVTQATGSFTRTLKGLFSSRSVEIDKRAWGHLEVLASDEFCSVRQLSLEANTKLSFQRHFCRDELYVALDDHIGLKIATNMKPDEEYFNEFSPKIHSITLEKGDYVLIPRGVWHRPEAYMNRVRILEISFGVYDQIFDIERFADDYSREGNDGKK